MSEKGEKMMRFAPVVADVMSPSYGREKREESLDYTLLCDVCDGPTRGATAYDGGWCDKHGLVATHKRKEK